jgi:putative peptide zinc metalloprotease protein
MKLNLHDSVENMGNIINSCTKRYTKSNEVVKVLMQLHANNLLFSKNRVDIESIFTSFSEKKQKEFTGKLISFLFIKLPIWNPEKWLENNKKLIHFIFSKKFFLIWLFFIFIGLKEVIDNSSNFMNQTQGMLSLNNMVYLYLCDILKYSMKWVMP